jgi:hypothetical protein
VAVRGLRGRPPGPSRRPAARRAPPGRDVAPAPPDPGRDRGDRGLDAWCSSPSRSVLVARAGSPGASSRS